MKPYRRLIAGVIICFITGVAINAQTAEAQTGQGNYYKAAIGLRAGETSGVTFNINTGQNRGLEFIAGFWSDWMSITALYELKAPAFNINGMDWYYGGGGHISFPTGSYYLEGREYPRGDVFALGVDGTVGLEYKIPQIPIAVNFGIKPYLEFYRDGNLYFGFDPGIGVKFTFGK